ncbi:AAA family ATPase [Pseudomonas yamanorum]|uniref:AAA family ATPase n=1 Tax=Pseudomonas yamanorum TaxID=515393 RepID=UPI003BA2AED5
MLFTTVDMFKGFGLANPLQVEGDMMVLTGKNGAGKTRFLESLAGEHTQAEKSGCKISKGEVRYFTYSDLVPTFKLGVLREHLADYASFNPAYYEKRARAAGKYFERNKPVFQTPYEPDRFRGSKSGAAGGDILDYTHLYGLVQYISTSIGRPVGELCGEDIVAHYQEPVGDALGVRNISELFNGYLKRREQNLYNRWRRQALNLEHINFLTDEEWLESSGPEPWKIINDIVLELFDGKFKFREPDQSFQSFENKAELVEVESDNEIEIAALSSGERTILWLVFTLFNAQYREPSVFKSPKILAFDEPDAFLHPKIVLKMYGVFKTFIEKFDAFIVFTTHSPTTIALAPENSVRLVGSNSITEVSKDFAISQLLEGVSQISLNSENQREVFVESGYDVDIYKRVFNALRGSSINIDPMISLVFIASGKKFTDNEIRDSFCQVFKGGFSQDEVDKFIAVLNGGGSRSSVEAMVKSLRSNGSKTVRGIIDWDLGNKGMECVHVLASDYAYSIENVIYDPVSVFYHLHHINSDRYSVAEYCGEQISIFELLQNIKLLQKVVDTVVAKVTGEQNSYDYDLEYVSGRTLKISKLYLQMKGKDLQQKIIESYDELRRDEKNLMLQVAKRMVLLGENFISKKFETLFSEVQRS